MSLGGSYPLCCRSIVVVGAIEHGSSKETADTTVRCLGRRLACDHSPILPHRCSTMSDPGTRWPRRHQEAGQPRRSSSSRSRAIQRDRLAGKALTRQIEIKPDAVPAANVVTGQPPERNGSTLRASTESWPGCVGPRPYSCRLSFRATLGGWRPPRPGHPQAAPR